MRVVIISGGKVEEAFVLEWLQKNKYDLLMAADSGMEFLYRNQITPDVIAGDFDSVGQEAYEHFAEKVPEIIRLNPMKDDTDTEFVIREATRRGSTSITVFGGTGTRLDHVLGNVHLLGIGLTTGVEISLVDSHNRIRMISKELVMEKESQFGNFVSILPFAGDAKGVTLKGFKYPLENAVLSAGFPLGISNEFLSEKCTIELRNGKLLIIRTKSDRI